MITADGKVALGVPVTDPEDVKTLTYHDKNETEEIERIRAAAKMSAIGMGTAIKDVRPGVTESQGAGATEVAMREASAEELWRTYVCSGPRTNIAHGLPTMRRIEQMDTKH